VIGHRGLPSGTKVHSNTSQQLTPPQLGAIGGTYALPHPFKKGNHPAQDRRSYGAGELSSDLSLCEGKVRSMKYLLTSLPGRRCSLLILC
jgi:hypothetical protein